MRKISIFTAVMAMAVMALVLSADLAGAAIIQVDIQSSGSNNGGGVTQSGWNAWALSESFNTTAHSTNFAYAPTTGGNLGVSITPTTNAGARNYGLSNISDPVNLANPNVWYDQYFTNAITTGATMTVALSNLKAGIYQFTSYHYANDLSIDGGATGVSNEGIASVFLNTGSGYTDTGMDVTFTSGLNSAGSRNLSAAQVMTDGTFTTSFTVANDNDSISIRYQDITDADSFGLNGFEVALIPEPSSGLLLLGATAALGLLRKKLHG